MIEYFFVSQYFLCESILHSHRLRVSIGNRDGRFEAVHRVRFRVEWVRFRVEWGLIYVWETTMDTSITFAS